MGNGRHVGDSVGATVYGKVVKASNLCSSTQWSKDCMRGTLWRHHCMGAHLYGGRTVKEGLYRGRTL